MLPLDRGMPDDVAPDPEVLRYKGTASEVQVFLAIDALMPKICTDYPSGMLLLVSDTPDGHNLRGFFKRRTIREDTLQSTMTNSASYIQLP